MQTLRKTMLATATIVLSVNLIACGGVAEPVSLNVNGTALSTTAAPLPGAQVQLNRGAVLTTDASGAFAASGVSAPYTMTVKSGTRVTEYVGVTSANPLAPVNPEGFTGKTGSVSGNVSGVTYPLPAGTAVAVAAGAGTISMATGVDSATGNFNIPVYWPTGGSTSTSVTGVRLQVASSTITGYHEAGTSANVTVSSGGTATGANPALGASITSGNVNVTYNMGAYTGLSSAALTRFKVGSTPFWIFGGLGGISSGSNVLIPSAGATFQFSGSSADGGTVTAWRSATPGSLNVSFPATPFATQNPTHLQSNVSKTPTFTWPAVPGASGYLLHVQKASAPSESYDIFLPGHVTSYAMPDFSALGAALAGSTSYEWHVRAYVGANLNATTATSATSGGLIFKMYTSDDWTVFRTKTTSFTTVP